MTGGSTSGWRRPDGSVQPPDPQRRARRLSEMPPRPVPPRPEPPAAVPAEPSAPLPPWGYTFHAWAFKRTPPPTVPLPITIVYFIGPLVATIVAFPHAEWPGLQLSAAISPVMTLAAFYAVRSWSRPRPIEEARRYHRLAHQQSLSAAQAGLDAARHYIPISFSTALQSSIVIILSGWLAVVGSYASFVMEQLGVSETSTLTFDLIVWGLVIFGALFAFLVGGIGWPRWPMPFVVREAHRTGKPIFKAEDYRAP
jgi:hypothetical protein